jgi:hypothetical protein
MIRFGPKFDAKGVLAGSKDTDRCIGYLAKYMTKQLGECHTPETERQRQHVARLAGALRCEPCSPPAPTGCGTGSPQKNPRPGLVPGACRGKAHRPEYLGYAGCRVLVSRRWSGKTLADHRGDRQARQFGPVTVAKAYRLLHAIFATAVDDRRVRGNPRRIEGAGKENSPEREMGPLTAVLAVAEATRCATGSSFCSRLSATCDGASWSRFAARMSIWRTARCGSLRRSPNSTPAGWWLIPRSPGLAAERSPSPPSWCPNFAGTWSALWDPGSEAESLSARRARRCAGRTSAVPGMPPTPRPVLQACISTTCATSAGRSRRRAVPLLRNSWPARALKHPCCTYLSARHPEGR